MSSLSPVPINDLSRGVARRRAEIDAAVTRVLDSGWLVLGPEVQAFEHELAAMLGPQFEAIGVANGTDALVLALQAVGVRADDRVVTAANAGGYASSAIRQLGAVPVYVDVDPDCLLMTLTSIEPALASRPRAVVVTHLYGRAVDCTAIVAACHAHDVAVIEDCAQAIGARIHGQSVGTFGDAAAFSFYPTKNLGALGDGGAVATATPDRAGLVRSLRQYGWKGKYRSANPGGRNSRLDEMQAAILRELLPGLTGANTRRRVIRSHYAAASCAVRFLGVDDESDVAHLAVCVTDNRDAVRAALDERGIRTDVHYPIADHRQPLSSAFEVCGILDVTEHATDHVLTVPCFPELTDDEVARVAAGLAAL